MAGAELHDVDALTQLRDALLKFRDSTAGLSTHLVARVQRAQAMLTQRKWALQADIDALRSVKSGARTDRDRADAHWAIQEASAELLAVNHRITCLGRALARHDAIAPSWNKALRETLPAAVGFLTQKHYAALKYQQVQLPAEYSVTSNNRAWNIDTSTIDLELGSGSSSVLERDSIITPLNAVSSEQLPHLPPGFTWVPLNQIEPSEFASCAYFQKVSYATISDGLHRLWKELIPLLSKNPNADRMACELFDEANGRMDKMGFVDPSSLAHLWDQFFDRRWKQHVRISIDARTDKWTVDNGRHRLRVARDLGWRFLPAELVKSMD
jgi:hypothetical protein